MIEGPTQTPYENGLFLFDICLPHDFPARPPNAHYISFWHDNLNPNLYVEGKVCVSLLGTWIAKRKEERWGPKSTLLQLIVSIQGLILVEQPYFNEPGYEGQYGNYCCSTLYIVSCFFLNIFVELARTYMTN